MTSTNVKVSSVELNIVNDVQNVITRTFPQAEIILYGSTAKGKRTVASDYDFLVITNSRVSEKQKEPVFDYVFKKYILEKNIEVSIFYQTRENWESKVMKGSPYYQNITQEGIVLS